MPAGHRRDGRGRVVLKEASQETVVHDETVA